MTFLKNICNTLGTKIIYVFCGTISGMITARYLGPHARGILTVITALPTTVLVVFGFGIVQANIYYIGKKKYQVSEIITNSLFVPFVIGIIVPVLLWFTKDIFILKILKIIDSHYLMLALVPVPAVMLSNSYTGILRGTEKFPVLNLIQVVQTLTALLFCVFILVIFKDGLTVLVKGIIILSFINVGCLAFAVSKISRPAFAFNKDLFKDVFRFGIKSHVQSIIGFLHNKIDLFMIAYFLVPAQVAFYDISVIIGEMLLFLPYSIAFVILPKLVRLNEEEKIHVASQTGRIAFFLTLIFGFGLVLIGKRLICLVYGKDYIEAFIPLCIMIPGLALSCLNSVIIPCYTSQHRQKVTITVSLISLIMNIVLNILMIPLYGIKGAAISTSITYSLFSLVLLALFYHENNIRITDMFVLQKKDIVLLKNYLVKQ